MIDKFLNTLYGDCDKGYLTLWSLPDKKTRYYNPKQIKTMAEDAVKLAETYNAFNVFYGVGIRRKELKEGRGSNEDVIGIPGTWIDIDIAGDAHKKGDDQLPTSMNEAVTFVHGLPLQPSLIINSGHGAHIYYLFKEPWMFDDDDERKKAAKVLESWQQYIQQQASTQHGWKFDSVHDLARVLRLPGTMNRKSTPVPVTILEDNGTRYNPSDFEDYTATKEAPPKKPSGIPEGTYGNANIILKKCAFLQHCRDDCRRLPEPEWHAMMTNLVRAREGIDLAHVLSEGYPGYIKAETDAKIQHALQGPGPHTCEYIRDNLRFNCPTGGCGVTAPVLFALNPKYSAAALVQKLLEEDRTAPDDVMQQDVIGALAIIRDTDGPQYALIKSKLKGKVNLVDLDKIVREEQVRQHHLVVVERNKPLPTADDAFPGCPQKNIKIPAGWTVNSSGIIKVIFKKGEEHEIQRASHDPVFLHRRLQHIDSDTERWEVVFNTDDKWKHLKAGKDIFSSVQGLITISKMGMPGANQVHGKSMVEYLSDFESCNRDDIEISRATDRMGWIKHFTEFMPGNVGDVELDVDSESMTSVCHGYKEEGSFELWKEKMGEMRKYPFLRFALACSFGSPLLAIFSERIFIVHYWNVTKSGKTAAAVAALSVWGDPELLIANFNATKVGLERLSGMYNDLILVIDEKQVLDGSKPEFVKGIIYILGGGKGKTRGSKDGGIQATSSWRNIVLTTGEEPLTLDSALGGTHTRVIELRCVPFPVEEDAKSMYSFCANNHGWAGPYFMREIIQSLKEDPNHLKNLFNSVSQKLQLKYPNHSAQHIQSISVAVVADIAASMFIWDSDDQVAIKQAMEMADAVIGLLRTTQENDTIFKAWDFITGWYFSNQRKFTSSDLPPRLGHVHIIDGVYIYPHYFRDALKDAGFSPDACIAAFAERGLIETAIEGGIKRFTVQKRFDSVKARFIHIMLKSDADESAVDEIDFLSTVSQEGLQHGTF